LKVNEPALAVVFELVDSCYARVGRISIDRAAAAGDACQKKVTIRYNCRLQNKKIPAAAGFFGVTISAWQ
jgi:hypothetical protein